MIFTQRLIILRVIISATPGKLVFCLFYFWERYSMMGDASCCWGLVKWEALGLIDNFCVGFHWFVVDLGHFSPNPLPLEWAGIFWLRSRPTRNFSFLSRQLIISRPRNHPQCKIPDPIAPSARNFFFPTGIIFPLGPWIPWPISTAGHMPIVKNRWGGSWIRRENDNFNWKNIFLKSRYFMFVYDSAISLDRYHVGIIFSRGRKHVRAMYK